MTALIRTFSFIVFFSTVSGASITDLRQRRDALPDDSSRARSVLSSEIATLLYNNGAYDDAIAEFDRSLQDGPPRFILKHIYLYLGKCYESSGRPDKSIDAYEKAVDYDKRNWKRHRDLARTYEMVKLHHNAIHSLQLSLKLNPTEPSVYFSLGQIWSEMRLYEKAETVFIKALDNGCDHAAVFNELSRVFQGQGKFGEAASALNEVISDTSPATEWARLIYLAALSQNEDLVKKGLSSLRRAHAGDETIHFYEELTTYLKRPSKTDWGHLPMAAKGNNP